MIITIACLFISNSLNLNFIVHYYLQLLAENITQKIE